MTNLPEMPWLLQFGQLAVYLVLATVFVVMIKADVKVIKVQMNGITENLKILNNSFEKMGDILSRVAVQDQRILGLEEDMREMKHGRGFIEGSLRGEYSRRGKIDD